MSLVGWWKEFQEELPAGWERAELRVQFGSPETCDRAAALLGPAQPFRIDPMALRFAASQDGTGPGPDAVTRLLERLDQSRIRGTIKLVGTVVAPAPPCARTSSLPTSWDAALAGLPPDWSDLYARADADLDRLRRRRPRCSARRSTSGSRATAPCLRFRSAQTFGYGASPGMVRRCFERCDAAEITGSVSVLRVLSDSRPVGTQGPVWLLDGKTI